MRDYISETVTVDGRSPIAGLDQTEYVVRAYSIISTDLVAFEVYVVPTAEDRGRFNATLHSDELGRLGQLTTCAPVESILALPYGDERTGLVGEHYDALREARDQAIADAFPGAPVGGGLTTIREFRGLVRS